MTASDALREFRQIYLSQEFENMSEEEKMAKIKGAHIETRSAVSISEDLRSEDLFLRSAASEMAGNAHYSNLVPNLIVGLQDGMPLVRASAAWALGVIGSRDAVPALVEMLEDKAELPQLRIHAADALGEIGDPRAIGVLGKYTGFTKNIGQWRRGLRLEALSAIAKIRDESERSGDGMNAVSGGKITRRNFLKALGVVTVVTGTGLVFLKKRSWILGSDDQAAELSIYFGAHDHHGGWLLDDDTKQELHQRIIASHEKGKKVVFLIEWTATQDSLDFEELIHIVAIEGGVDRAFKRKQLRAFRKDFNALRQQVEEVFNAVLRGQQPISNVTTGIYSGILAFLIRENVDEIIVPDEMPFDAFLHYLNTAAKSEVATANFISGYFDEYLKIKKEFYNDLLVSMKRRDKRFSRELKAIRDRKDVGFIFTFRGLGHAVNFSHVPDDEKKFLSTRIELVGEDFIGLKSILVREAFDEKVSPSEKLHALYSDAPLNLLLTYFLAKGLEKSEIKPVLSIIFGMKNNNFTEEDSRRLSRYLGNKVKELDYTAEIDFVATEMFTWLDKEGKLNIVKNELPRLKGYISSNNQNNHGDGVSSELALVSRLKKIEEKIYSPLFRSMMKPEEFRARKSALIKKWRKLAMLNKEQPSEERAGYIAGVADYEDGDFASTAHSVYLSLTGKETIESEVLRNALIEWFFESKRAEIRLSIYMALWEKGWLVKELAVALRKDLNDLGNRYRGKALRALANTRASGVDVILAEAVRNFEFDFDIIKYDYTEDYIFAAVTIIKLDARYIDLLVEVIKEESSLLKNLERTLLASVHMLRPDNLGVSWTEAGFPDYRDYYLRKRKAAARALIESGEPRAMDALKELLTHRDVKTAFIAYDALSRYTSFSGDGLKSTDDEFVLNSEEFLVTARLSVEDQELESLELSDISEDYKLRTARFRSVTNTPQADRVVSELLASVQSPLATRPLLGETTDVLPSLLVYAASEDIGFRPPRGRFLGPLDEERERRRDRSDGRLESPLPGMGGCGGPGGSYACEAGGRRENPGPPEPRSFPALRRDLRSALCRDFKCHRGHQSDPQGCHRLYLLSRSTLHSPAASPRRNPDHFRFSGVTAIRLPRHVIVSGILSVVGSALSGLHVILVVKKGEHEKLHQVYRAGASITVTGEINIRQLR